LAALPRGAVKLAEVNFDVRGVVQLRSRASPPAPHAFPDQVDGIRVDAPVRRLHFLHATQRQVAEGAEIGRYVVRSAKGTREMCPLRPGQNIRDGWLKSGEPTCPPDLAEAWRGTNAKATANGTAIRLFRWTWENPSAQARVESIDFIAGETASAP